MDREDIDFVIIWVDGADAEWRREKAKYRDGGEPAGDTDIRYRDWEIMRYWFRSVERCAPWVRRIHFVTCGHAPNWLDLTHPKLHFVKHSDYMKPEYLPTFSSHPIELNLHRIDGLAERFVYFNDDMFINAPVRPEDFFANGMPRDCAIMNTIKMDRHGIPHIIVNNLCVLSDHFDFRVQFRRNMGKWLSPKYGALLLRTMFLLPWRIYSGFYEMHTPYSFLKSTFREVWEQEGDMLDEVCRHRFRDNADVNQWLMRYWQLAKGQFVPRSPKFGKLYLAGTDMDAIVADITGHHHSMICINDSEDIPDFDAAKAKLIQAFEREYPEKSGFEL